MNKVTRRSVSLLHSTTEANAVSWSQDQRIAVTASEAVYVLTLKRPQSFKSTSPVPPKSLPEPQTDGKPLFVINTAPAPLKEKLASLNIGDVARGSLTSCPQGAKWNMLDMVDPLLVTDHEASGQSCDLFKASYWTPAGYSHLGGCVLTALTSSGRLLLFTPPGNTGNCWKMTLDLTFHLSTLLLPGKNRPKMPKPAMSAKGTSVEQHSTKNGSTTNADVDCSDPESTPRAKRVKVGSNSGFSDEYRARRLSVACTTCAWLPTLLLVNCEVIGVIAIATRTGHVILLGVKLPIVFGEMNADPVSLICDYQLPLDADRKDGWGCSLCWLPSSCSTVSLITPTFYMAPRSDGSVHTQLMVGCTNGQVFGVQWEISGVNGVEGSVSSSVSSVNGVTGVCCISGVSAVTGRVSQSTCLWEEADGVPVYSTACQSRFSGCDLWVVFGKSQLLIAEQVNCDYQKKDTHIKIPGRHKMTISGIAAYSEYCFVSSALDGTVQTFNLDHTTVSAGHVTPSPVTLETQVEGERGMKAQGIAVSETGLFAAVMITTDNKSKHKKLRFNSQLQFVSLATPSDVEGIIKRGASSQWDICEFLRRQYSQQHTFLQPLQEMITQMSKGRVIPVPKLQILLQANIISGKREGILQCSEGIIHRHVLNSLKSWLEWETHTFPTEGGATEPSQGSDTQSQCCVQLMAQWLLTCADHPTVQETKLANKVLGTCTLTSPSTSPKPKSPKSKPVPHLPPGPAPSLEKCEACGEGVPLTNLLQDSCSNGHTWSRCGLTLCLASDARCSSCIQCGTIVNNALTINVEAGSWLNSLLQKHICCIFCGGYFEQVI